MATYKEIQAYVKSTYGFTPKTCWIAHMKEVCGLPVKMANNRYSPDNREKPCPLEKMQPIKETFRYFKMI
ncbi:MAG: hypothetical protein LBM65_05605 [Oscillospiraceae bacterium]|jgi:hypothetical protein|nr:hypothetical protein [Oscillospiraceae bacterium]